MESYGYALIDATKALELDRMYIKVCGGERERGMEGEGERGRERGGEGDRIEQVLHNFHLKIVLYLKAVCEYH
jgi:hypothetical protein